MKIPAHKGEKTANQAGMNCELECLVAIATNVFSLLECERNKKQNNPNADRS
jgi:hypothetical protein